MIEGTYTNDSAIVSLKRLIMQLLGIYYVNEIHNILISLRNTEQEFITTSKVNAQLSYRYRVNI